MPQFFKLWSHENVLISGDWDELIPILWMNKWMDELYFGVVNNRNIGNNPCVCDMWNIHFFHLEDFKNKKHLLFCLFDASQQTLLERHEACSSLHIFI